jgi:hypothetical protein
MVFFIWDRTGAKYIHLERFPAYAPELNPDEGVWQHLKHVELRNLCCTDLDHLRAELNLAIRRLRSKPDLIQSFFFGCTLRPMKGKPINAVIYSARNWWTTQLD